MSKTISKPLLDEAIKQARLWFDVTIPYENRDVHTFMAATDVAYPKLDAGYIFSDLLSSIMTHSGLKPDATNEDIYKVLEVLGWTVTDEGGNEE